MRDACGGGGMFLPNGTSELIVTVRANSYLIGGGFKLVMNMAAMLAADLMRGVPRIRSICSAPMPTPSAQASPAPRAVDSAGIDGENISVGGTFSVGGSVSAATSRCACSRSVNPRFLLLTERWAFGGWRVECLSTDTVNRGSSPEYPGVLEAEDRVSARLPLGGGQTHDPSDWPGMPKKMPRDILDILVIHLVNYLSQQVQRASPQPGPWPAWPALSAPSSARPAPSARPEPPCTPRRNPRSIPPSGACGRRASGQRCRRSATAWRSCCRS